MPRRSPVLHRDTQEKLSCLKLKGLELRYLLCSIVQWSSTKIVQIMPLGSTLAPPWGSPVLHRDIQGKTLKIFLSEIQRHRAQIFGVQHCLVVQDRSNYASGVKIGPLTGSLVLQRDIQGKTSCLKLKGPELRHLVFSIVQLSSTNIVQIMALGSKLACPRGHLLYIEIYREKL